MTLVSTRNSPVKTFVSRTASFVRLLSFSQVKSANANGFAAFFASGFAASEDEAAGEGFSAAGGASREKA